MEAVLKTVGEKSPVGSNPTTGAMRLLEEIPAIFFNFLAKTLDILYYELYNTGNESEWKEISMMYSALLNKQNDLQKLWRKCNANGSFVMSVCASNSAGTAE